MRTLALLASLSLSAAVAQAQLVQTFAPEAGATVIDFNAYPAYSLITSQYAGLGVTTTSCVFTENVYNSLFAGDVMQAANFDNRGHDCDGHTAYAPITFNFSTTMHHFGLYGISNSSIFLTNAHGSVSAYAPVSNATFVGFSDAAGFTSVTISADLSGAFAFDDMSFDAVGTVAPEPASIALMLTGLLAIGGLAGVRRRSPRS